jgi:hypothetical protein
MCVVSHALRVFQRDPGTFWLPPTLSHILFSVETFSVVSALMSERFVLARVRSGGR